MMMIIVDEILEILRGFFFQSISLACRSDVEAITEVGWSIPSLVCTVKKVKQTFFITFINLQ